MILLDNGHGNNTSGKRSPVWPDGSQLFEWEFNRDVVKRIQKRLELLKIPSSILVKEARDISLKTRCDRANAVYRQYPGSFLISIHGNAGGGRGWEVWTSKGQTESDLLATFLYNQAKVWLPQFKMRCDYIEGKDPDKEADFYILKNTLCPAVLTENLFYSDLKECQFMLSDFGRAIISGLHVDAISEYLKIKPFKNNTNERKDN
jgi:N-acetylmuramoyl-L-alanine amidase